MSDSPFALSVILFVLHDLDDLRYTLPFLRQQSIAAQLEIVVVTAQPLANAAERLQGFGGYQIVQIPAWRTFGAAYSVGVQAARADFVVMGEDHSFPAPTWAAEIVHTFADVRIAVVSPAMHNANPGVVSWADMVISFSTSLLPPHYAPIMEGAGHNSAYRRELLLREFGAQLETALNMESALHRRWHEQGYAVMIQPSAVTHHINISQFGTAVRSKFYGAWVYAAERSRTWSGGLRLLYLGGMPLVPLLRGYRHRAILRRLWEERIIGLSVLVVLWLFYLISALGEGCGYVWGYSTYVTEQYYVRDIQRWQSLPPHELANLPILQGKE